MLSEIIWLCTVKLSTKRYQDCVHCIHKIKGLKKNQEEETKPCPIESVLYPMRQIPSPLHESLDQSLSSLSFFLLSLFT